MDKKLIVSPSPHIHSGASTSKLMRDVIIALVPAFLVSVYFYGLPALMTTLVAVGSAVIFEYLISKYILNQKPSICDYSAALTGFLLAFNLPSDISWWIVVIGSLAAIGIAKMSYGGLGKNLFNPALVGRVVLLISFPAQMTTFPDIAGSAEIDATSGATFLTYVKAAISNNIPISEAVQNLSIVEMFIGKQSGSMGEVSAVALLIGFIYLLYRKVITWHIPVAVLGTMAVFSGILCTINSDIYLNPLFQIISGGALLGAIFMATDYVTSPMNIKGMVIFGVGIGLLTIIIRTWGAYAEGMSFAILIMNAATPLINKCTRPKRFGETIKK